MQPSFPTIYGTASLNEKGQIVIPHDARQAMNISAGSKLMVMNSPHGKGLFLVKIEDVESRIKGIVTALQDAKNQTQESA